MATGGFFFYAPLWEVGLFAILMPVSSSHQCNVYNSGQRRKLLNFKGFSRKVILIVPNEEDWKQRLELRKETEKDDVPESVMLEMKGRLSEGFGRNTTGQASGVRDLSPH